MRPDERNTLRGNNPQRRSRFELFFFEQVGARSYLRFTGLALFLIVCLIVVPVALLLSLFMWNQSNSPVNTNVNIVTPKHRPDDYQKPIIQPAPPAPAPPRVVKQPKVAVPVTQVPPVKSASPSKLSTTPSPSPTPVRTPT